MNQGQRKKERHAQLEKVASSVSSSSGHDREFGQQRQTPSPQFICSSSAQDMFGAAALWQPLSGNLQTNIEGPGFPFTLVTLPPTESIPASSPDGVPAVHMAGHNSAHSSDLDLGTDLFIDPMALAVNTSSSDSGSDLNSSPDLWDPPLSLSAFLQVDDVASASFADDKWVAVTELDLLRAAYSNATRIKSADRLWDLGAASVFTTQSASGWVEQLPDNLRPTSTQLTQPHHPSIDVLPWPSVRDKLIKMWNMPEDFWPRHPIDRERLTLIRFVFDMENGGVRIWGAEADAHEGWEVDQYFVDVWWWALDQNVLANSNRRRMRRGLPMLRLKAPGSLMAGT